MENNFIASCLIANIIIWLSGISYLLFKSPVYTSEWIVTLPGTGKSTSINLPQIGEVESRSDSPYNFYADPRENYSSLAKHEEVLRAAAQRLGIEVEDFGQPHIKIVDNTTMMEFAIDGETAQIAKNKASALNSALQNKLNQLRKEEIEQLNSSLEVVLENSQDNLKQAKANLAAYQEQTPLNRKQQLDDISTNIEELRKSRSETLVEIQQIQAFLRDLSTELGLSSQEAAAVIKLQANSVFREHLAQYSKASAELVNVQGRFLPSHPEYIALQDNKKIKEAELIELSQAILGSSLSGNIVNLVKNYTRSIDNQEDSLLNQLVSAQARRQGLESQAKELNQQIKNLEQKLKTLTKQESTFETLQKELQVAETIFSTNLTNLNLEKSDIFASYPSLQMFTVPSAPEKPSSPNPKLTFLGMTFSSLLVTTGLIYWKKLKSLENSHQLDLKLLQLNNNSQLDNLLDSEEDMIASLAEDTQKPQLNAEMKRNQLSGADLKPENSDVNNDANQNSNQ